MEINHVGSMGSVKPVKICHKPIVTNMTDNKYHGYLERGQLVSSDSLSRIAGWGDMKVFLNEYRRNFHLCSCGL
jgi:hypothetical protein